MKLIDRQDRTNPEISAAEDAVEKAYFGGDRSFYEGVVGGHETFGSWFSSGLSGLFLSQALSEEAEQDLFVKRNAAGYGMDRMNATLEAYKQLNATRGLTENELSNVKELVRRKQIMEDDLVYVDEQLDGDLSAPMDEKGQSFDDRWGVGDDEVGVYDFLQSLVNNPKYSAGVLTGEMIKDAPLSVLAWAGLTAKTAKGASAVSKLMAKINNIQPKALRGLAKVSAPIGAGAAVGAGYEASYSTLNEGKINWGDVQTGTEFGAAFGVLGALGLIGKSAFAKGDEIAGVKQPDAEVETTQLSPEEEINYTREEVEQLVDEVITERDNEEMTKMGKTLMDEHESRIFPELSSDDYVFVSRDEAIKAGYINADESPFRARAKRVEGLKKQLILWDNQKIEEGANSFYKEAFDRKTSGRGTLQKLAPRHIGYLRNPETYRAFVLAHEKAHVLQRKNNTQFKPHPRDVEFNDGSPGSFRRERHANALAARELDRAFKEYQTESADLSEVVATAQAEAEGLFPKGYHKKKEKIAKTEVRDREEQVAKSRVADFLEQNKLASAAVVGAAGYAATEGPDAPYMAAAGVAAVIGGPKAYRKFTEVSIPQIVAKARYQAAHAKEGLDVYAKQLEVLGQDLSDTITKTFPGEAGLKFLDVVEGKGKFKDPEHQKIATQWKKFHEFLARQGAEAGLFVKKFKKQVNMNLVANYASHIIRGKIGPDGKTRPLTNQEKEELIQAQADKIKLIGSVSTVHNIPRKIQGTISDLKAKGYDVVEDPAQIVSIYTQAMARTIHNRKLLDEFKQLDLGTREKPLPGLFSKEDFDRFVEGGRLSKDEQLHYSDFDHPALKGHMVHSNLRDMLNDHFEISREGGFNDFKEGLLSLNNSLKRIFVFGSLFHGQALFMSSMYSLGLTGALKGIFGKGKLGEQHSWQDFKLGTGQFKEMAREAIRDGLQIINVKRQELVNPGKVELDEWLDKMGGFGVAGKKAFGAIDKVTWEFLHDRYKLAAYLRHKEKLMQKGVREHVAGKKAAEFANDAFGSLDWSDFATRLYRYAANNPHKLRSKAATKLAQVLPVNKRRWLNLGLFAPDWTISNIRIIGKTFTGLPEVSKAMAKRVQTGKWGPKEKEIVQAWNMYAAYATRAGFYTSGMWWMMTEMFSDEPATAENLLDFWFGEQSGKLQLGNGESMVISKQIAEPIHWVQHPQHTLMNKASVVPKTLMEGMFNKQWFSMKKGFPMGPSIVDMDEEGNTHYGKWILGKAIPIVAKPLIDDNLDWKERFERTFTGFFGFPQYGKPE